MDVYRTEDEQVEALHRWWQDNGRSTITAVIIAVGAGFGWQGWQQHQQQQAVDASLQYEQMLEAVRQPSGDERAATVRHLADSLIADYPGSSYAWFARLHLARQAVDGGDYEAAAMQLRAVLAENPGRQIELLARLRLARVVAAAGDPQAGLQIIDSVEAGAYGAVYAEVEGDIQLQLGNRAAAVSAYEKSLALAVAAGIGAGPGLQLKLQSLTPVAARPINIADAPEGE